jgi:GYF domain 2
MHWYYEKGGQQVGPLTDEQFHQAVRKGDVLQNTLVWNETLSGWVAYKTVMQPQIPTTPAPPLPFAQKRAGTSPVVQQCSQCSRSLPQEEMIQYGGVWICAACKPLFFQRLKEGGRSGGVWRDGKLMVATKGATLPDRCVKCNRPANGLRLTRKLYWHPPAYYLLICGGVLLYAIVALIVRKNTVLDFGICELHKNKRKRWLAITWSLVALAVVLFIAGAVADEGGIAAIGGLVLFLSLIFGVLASQFVTPRKMETDGLVWLKGVNAEYLQLLPAYQSF